MTEAEEAVVALMVEIVALIAAQSAIRHRVRGDGGEERAEDGGRRRPLPTRAPTRTSPRRLNSPKVQTRKRRRNAAGDPRNVTVTLPPGLIGNPTATEKCSQAAMLELKWLANCKPEAQIGIATIVSYNGSSSGFPTTVPLYNLEPPTGVAAASSPSTY